MKRLIVITSPQLIENEAELLVTALDAGADYLHLRKPHSTCSEVAKLIDSIPCKYHPQIVLHDHHPLAENYAVGGLHLNSRCPIAPSGWNGRLSRSCHSLEEVIQYKGDCNYMLLSPIYNSISKAGYTTPFTPEQLSTAHQAGIIDEQVVAMGGIHQENITETLACGFGGVALLGSVWCNPTYRHINTTIKNIKTQLLCYNL